MTTAAPTRHLPSKQQVRRTASEFAVSLAVELLVLGVVRRRRARRSDRRARHRLLRAMAAEVAAEGATGVWAQRRRLAVQFDRLLDAQIAAARHHR